MSHWSRSVPSAAHIVGYHMRLRNVESALNSMPSSLAY